MEAYSQTVTSHLRKRRTPEEFIKAIKFRAGATDYFDTKRVVDDALLAVGDDAEKAAAIRDVYSTWKTNYFATHPIFAEEIQSGEGRMRRARIMEQMKHVVNDPGAPQSPQLEAARELVDAMTVYEGYKKQYSSSRSAESKAALRGVKEHFADWAEAWSMRYPDMARLWDNVYKPEADIKI